MTEGQEEGDRCNRDGCPGLMQFPIPADCACHISAPCNACLDARPTCDECEAEAEA